MSKTPLQWLIEELELRCNPKFQTGNEDLFLEKEGMKMVRVLKGAQGLREALEDIKKFPKRPNKSTCHECGDGYAETKSEISKKALQDFDSLLPNE